MICGAELGEREKYCGNCGTKAPDGAVDKKEIEPKHIIEQKPHEPWMDYTWKAQNLFCEIIHTKFKHRYIPPLYCIIMFRFYAYGISFIQVSVEDLKKISDFMGCINCFVDIIFGILFCIIWLSTFIICGILLSFKKNAPQMLYIHCGIRILAFPAYAVFSALTNMFYSGFGWIAIIEGLTGVAALIISLKYYDKRRNAFIY